MILSMRYADERCDDEELERVRLSMRKLRLDRSWLARDQLRQMLRTLYEQKDGAEQTAAAILQDWLKWSEGLQRNQRTEQAGFRRVWLYRELERCGVRVERSRRSGAVALGITRRPVL